ncbi:alpha/beta hydrolase [Pedobacter gandavensis]|uniref:alpha/beta fold hydrolase n=1 Tax=Pedobacter gandavensis TaxID=2679963 RepID=UPI00292D7421|nr:alpha/beta hydrolase [Pedobacter gandavensis]
MLDHQYFNFIARDGCRLNAAIFKPKNNISKSTLVLLHGGGPDHQSLLPLAKRLCYDRTVILPDVRGYGKSVCYDPNNYTWANYASDINDLLNYLQIPDAVIGGAGIGTTISLKAAITYPERVSGLILISVEDIEDDESKALEVAFFEQYMDQIRQNGLTAAWESILSNLSPVIGAMVRDAIPRSDAKSILAAASIVYDRAFYNINELREISVPLLVIPGNDQRHPSALAIQLAQLLKQAVLSNVGLSDKIRTMEDFADAFTTVINSFLNSRSW